MADAWKPEVYERFKAERSRPFFDLLGLVQPVSGGRAVDLGCGTGELTHVLHRRLELRETLGLDLSDAMLAKAAAFTGSGLSFCAGDLAAFDERPWDLLFSNAAIHWAADHPRLLSRWFDLLRPGGQLAVQLPANHEHVSHAVADELAAEPEWASRLSGWRRKTPVMTPAQYAIQLQALGFVEQRVFLEVYGHLLESRESVVDWVKGTTLTAYLERLSSEDAEGFVNAYRERLLPRLNDRRPFFFPFPRILFWARKASEPMSKSTPSAASAT